MPQIADPTCAVASSQLRSSRSAKAVWADEQSCRWLTGMVIAVALIEDEFSDMGFDFRAKSGNETSKACLNPGLVAELRRVVVTAIVREGSVMSSSCEMLVEQRGLVYSAVVEPAKASCAFSICKTYCPSSMLSFAPPSPW
jgi:hypothetical protein